MTDDFAQKYGRWAVIAGASEGVGASLADQLAERGLDLVLIARNQALLAEVATRVRERHGVEVRPVVLDLTVPDISRARRRGDRWARSRTGHLQRWSREPDGRVSRRLVRGLASADPAGVHRTGRAGAALRTGDARAWSRRHRSRRITCLPVRSVAARRVLGGEGVQRQLRRGAVGGTAPARRRRVLCAARHDLHGGIPADGRPLRPRDT